MIQKYDIHNFGLVVLGSLVLALGYGLFIVPHNVVPGGVFGLSIVINQLIGLPVGIIALGINIPLLFWGTKVLGRRTGIKTAVSMVSVSMFLDLITYLTNNQIIVDDILVSTLFGGVLIATAIGIVMSAGATTGGNDIFVRIIGSKINLPFSQLILIVDGIIVLIGVIVFGDFTLAAYCIIAIIAISKTVDYIINHADKNKTLLIFSGQNKAIQAELLANVKVTENIVKLVHHDSDRKMIVITKNTKKLNQIEQIIYSVDAKADVIALESSLGLRS